MTTGQPIRRTDNSRLTPTQEAAAVRMMLKLRIPAVEVAEWRADTRRQREAAR